MTGAETFSSRPAVAARGTSFWAARLRKEVRGLLPAWLACLVVMVIAASIGDKTRAVGLLAYLFGAVTMGALSMGHEYNCRTLGLLLSHPAKRERLYLEKLGVLVAMLLVLFGVAWLGVFEAVPLGRSGRLAENYWALALLLAPACGLFLAPWLTMICRNPLAGAVFAIAIPGTLWVSSDLLSAAVYGADLSATAEASDFAFDMFWRGVAIVCVVAGVSSWRMFMRLEATDSRGLDVGFPSWLTRRATSVSIAAAPARSPAETGLRTLRRNAIWLLAKKELRLQQLTFAISGLYVFGWAGLVLFGPIAPASRATLLYAITLFHTAAIPLLAGSVASAEERQLGTLEWQVLLPMAAWKQWSIKTGIALGVAVGLTLSLPPLLIPFTASPEVHDSVGRVASAPILLTIVPVVIGSLFISSMSANGLRAILISAPALFAVVMGLASPVSNRLSGVMAQTWRSWYWMYQNWAAYTSKEVLYVMLMNVLVVLMYAGVLGLLLRFALANHRSAERGMRHVLKQMTALVALVAIGMTLWGGVWRLYASEMREQTRLNWLTVTVGARDSANNAVKDYVVVIFREDAGPSPGPRFVASRGSEGTFKIIGFRPGRYALAAVDGLTPEAQRNPELVGRLKDGAIPVTLAPGEAKSLTLQLSKF